ncbi:hypothetical protein [[Kitasatospora] papulosa]|uniref:hypothetical protein n=1 Tax=[Kitasatospora] papulosa TaxID=1464011 RepID=UPI0036AC2005
MSNRQKEVKELLRKIRKEASSIERTGTSHWAATHKTTGATVYIPGTPSDVRALKNKRRDLRAAGFTI